MIYSVHNPFTGLFDYFEAKPDVAINDDLPTPRWPSHIKTSVGVPASEAARPLPPGAVAAGSGALPVGLISTGIVGVWQGTQKGEVPSGMGSFDTPVKTLPVVLLMGGGASVLYGMRKDDGGWPYLALGAACLLLASYAAVRS